MPKEKAPEIEKQEVLEETPQESLSAYEYLQYEVEVKKLELQLAQLERLIFEERVKLEESLNQAKKRTLKTS
jgi:hypothetical protein